MAPFAGWEMPIQYPAGILGEHRHTRERASLFDTCHMSEFRLSGADIAQTLDSVFARGTADQKVGTCRYNFLLSESGTILDDLIVYRLAASEFFVVANAGTHESDAKRIQERLPDGTVFEDVSDATGKVDLQGPASAAVLVGFGIPEDELPTRFRCAHAQLFGAEVLISGTGYTGELGYELYADSADIPTLWDRILQCDAVSPAGLGARDTLRLEAGLPLYGHDLDDTTTPVEAGFSWVLKPTDRPFIGREALERPPRRRLVGFTLTSRRAAREGTSIFDDAGHEVGTVTSGSFGPTVGTAIGLGYVNGADVPPPGTPCRLGRSYEKAMPGEFAELPFYRAPA